MADGDDDATLFPQKLMDILADPLNEEAISWIPNGQAFVIRDRELFVEIVMPKYFSRKALYSSFTRKLNRWNFKRVTFGPDHGAFYHKFFLRDKPHLVAQIFCKNARTLSAMDVAENKAEVLLKEDSYDPITQRVPIINSPVLHSQSSIFGPTKTLPAMQQMKEMRLDSFHVERALNRALNNPLAAVLLRNSAISSRTEGTRTGGSATYDPMNLQFEMLLQLEKVKLNSLLVERALKMHQEHSCRQDRIQQVRRMMVASLQQSQLQEQNNAPNLLLIPGKQSGDRRVANIHRASVV